MNVPRALKKDNYLIINVYVGKKAILKIENFVLSVTIHVKNANQGINAHHAQKIENYLTSNVYVGKKAILKMDNFVLSVIIRASNLYLRTNV